MNIDFKEGVTPDKLKAITFRAIFICAEVFNRKNYQLIITSTHEGDHLPNSYHYNGQAFDIRTWRIPQTFLPSMCAKLTKALHEIDTDFQVILEPDHIHIELDNRK